MDLLNRLTSWPASFDALASYRLMAMPNTDLCHALLTFVHVERVNMVYAIESVHGIDRVSALY